MGKKIYISEHFFSIQGEGHSAGTPAVFLRLGGCGLNCQWCDTAEVWRKSVPYTPEELTALFNSQGYSAMLSYNGARLVITGGDPMLQQEALVEWLSSLIGAHKWAIEVEHQGTIIPSVHLQQYVCQWNISPKLSNSGVPEEKRNVPEAMIAYVRLASFFKFPVKTMEDFKEAVGVVVGYNIPRERVFLMPLSSSEEEHREVSKKVIEMCKSIGFRYSPRLQLAVYDKSCGV